MCLWKGKIATIFDDSVIMCDEVIESYDKDVEAKSYNETKTIPTNFNGKKATCKNLSIFIFYLYFY